MTLIENGELQYRLHFMGRPDLDRDRFTTADTYNVGDEFSTATGKARPGDIEPPLLELEDEWEVIDVLYAPDGERDTLTLAPVTR